MNAVQQIKQKHNLDLYVDLVTQMQKEAQQARKAAKEARNNVIRMDLYLAQKAARVPR